MNLDLDELFEKNRRWAAQTEAREPGFFSRLLEQQTPQYLWIGCADSRVPANELVGLLPGELFVHRNVANVVAHSDLNALCERNVLEQALNVCDTTVVQDAWSRGQEVVVHGWVYGLHNGLLEDLKITAAAADQVAAAYETALAAIVARYTVD